MGDREMSCVAIGSIGMTAGVPKCRPVRPVLDAPGGHMKRWPEVAGRCRQILCHGLKVGREVLAIRNICAIPSIPASDGVVGRSDLATLLHCQSDVHCAVHVKLEEFQGKLGLKACAYPLPEMVVHGMVVSGKVPSIPLNAP